MSKPRTRTQLPWDASEAVALLNPKDWPPDAMEDLAAGRAKLIPLPKGNRMKYPNRFHPDPDDLTPLIARLPKEKPKDDWWTRAIERCERDGLRYGFYASVAFWILALGFACVAIWWGWKQLLE